MNVGPPMSAPDTLNGPMTPDRNAKSSNWRALPSGMSFYGMLEPCDGKLSCTVLRGGKPATV